MRACPRRFELAPAPRRREAARARRWATKLQEGRCGGGFGGAGARENPGGARTGGNMSRVRGLNKDRRQRRVSRTTVLYFISRPRPRRRYRDGPPSPFITKT